MNIDDIPINAPPLIGEILFYEHSNIIKREPEDIAFYNEGIIENSSTAIENTHPQYNEGIIENASTTIENTHLQYNEGIIENASTTIENTHHQSKELISEITDKNELLNENLVGEAVDLELSKQELVGEAFDDKVPKGELVGEAVDFDCGLAEDTKVHLENTCISILAEPIKENEKVNISLIVNSPAEVTQNDKDFYIQQTNSESLLLYKCKMCPNPHFFKCNYLENPHKAQKSPPPANKKDLKYKCEVPGCEYKTCQKNKLDNHAIVHSDDIYKCDECAFMTKSKKYLGNHKDSIHNPNSQRFFCKKCTYNSISQMRFRQHEMSHIDPSLRETYKCPFLGCPYESKSKKSISRHAIVHKDPSEVKSLKCPSCAYETTSKRNLKHHLRIHNKHLRETMYCFNCSFKTVSKGSLRIHMLTHTKVEALEMFKCSQCSYMAKRKGHLLQHMIKHSDIEMLKCFKCAFETKRKHTLRNHMGTHKKS